MYVPVNMKVKVNVNVNVNVNVTHPKSVVQQIPMTISENDINILTSFEHIVENIQRQATNS